MNLHTISRRRLLRHATLASASGAMGIAATANPAAAAEPPRAERPRPDGLDVRDFGAVGDGGQKWARRRKDIQRSSPEAVGFH